MPATVETPMVIVTGMHHSGALRVASMLSPASATSGGITSPAEFEKSTGYSEDLEFFKFHARVFSQSCVSDEPGYSDWGWTESEWLDVERFNEFRNEAQRLLLGRRSGPNAWAWADPRATLLLDFWDSVIENARYVLVYRFPWDVADSMQRHGEAVFLKNPEYAYRIWTFYNRHLRDFYLKHRDRCLLVSSNALQKSLDKFAFLLGNKLGLAMSELGQGEIFKDDSFKTIAGHDPLIDLVSAAWPECTQLLCELDGLADVSGDGLWQARSHKSRLLRPDAIDDQPVDLSVIIPSYEQGPLLIEAIASVERNAPQRSELIIVNDGSRQPRTLEILQLLRELGYFIVDQENAGPSAARNRAISYAKGRYILPLDDDNRLAPGFSEEAMGLLGVSPEIGIVYGDRYDFGLRQGVKRVPEFDLTALFKKNYIDTCAIYRKQVWMDCGGYDSKMDPNEDWEFWIHAAEAGWLFHRIPKVTFEYRVRPGSLITAIDTVEILDRYRKAIRMKHTALYSTVAVAESEALTLKLEKAELRIAELEGDLQRLKGELARTADDLQTLETQVAQRDSQIDRMTGSAAWRLLNYYGRFKYRYLLPAYRLFARGPAEKGETKSITDR